MNTEDSFKESNEQDKVPYGTEKEGTDADVPREEHIADNIDENLEKTLQKDVNDTQDVENAAWDGSEAELISEEEKEKYSENRTGVKIKYVLSEAEIYEFFKHTDGYRKNRVMQRNYIIIQAVIFLLLVGMWLFLNSVYYLYLTIFPIVAAACIGCMPLMARKKLAKQFCSGEQTCAEIFPDKVVLERANTAREVSLDESCECEESAGMILIYPKKGQTVMIPMRAIDPERMPDVQAMIFAGSKPRYEG